MDPVLANQDFDPPPPSGLGRWIVPALLIHIPLVLALGFGVDWNGLPGAAPAAAAPAPAPTTATAPATAPQRVAAAAPAPPKMAAAAVQPRTTCPLRPLLEAADGRDGQLFPPADVVGKGAADVAPLLQVGKEAAAGGQRRDAEVAFLTACRIADAAKGPGSVESADARYQLGRHYAAVVAATQGRAPESERQGLLKRAEAFYADSLQGYQASLGQGHEKSAFAAEGLEAVRQRATQAAGASAASTPAAPPATAPATAPAPARASPPASAPAAKRAPAPASVPVSGGSEPRPSFSCARARSAPEKIICADPELAQLDRDLGRLHARAKRAAVDPAAFRRQNDAEWREREADCRDRECLLSWYTHRRQQLLVTLEQGGADEGDSAAR